MRSTLFYPLFSVFFLLCSSQANAQLSSIKGTVASDGQAIEFANIYLIETEQGTTTDSTGFFEIPRVKPGEYTLRITFIGYEPFETTIRHRYGEDSFIEAELKAAAFLEEEIVVTGTMKAISRSKSPVPVEVFSPEFFKMNPTPTLYEAMQSVNGVRPQLNCNVCNTGDIHINGLEGAYTMVLIDGMPIVSSLSTVYGLFAIPNSMIEQVEVVKGPASTLYGSEALGGLINVITKKPSSAPTLTVDGMGSSWAEMNLDIGGRFQVGEKADVLTGVNLFNYNTPIDNNGDNFTDISLAQRASLFQKWSIDRADGKLFTLAGRFFYEDRWGGEMDWTRSDRGGDQIYGESIYTTRWELIGNYQLPTTENMMLSFSYNDHYQDSYYGDTFYLGDQRIGFAQLTWDKNLNNHSLLIGSALRYTRYDDNTPATASAIDVTQNRPDEIWLPGIFVQDDFTIDEKSNLLLGLRYDYNSTHGNVWTPRFAYKFSPNANNIFRINAGTGFRVVNLFTEDHAALTGARQVIIEQNLQPEQSYNVNLNYERKFFFENGTYLGLDASSWYTYFTNQIFPDYESNANEIRYSNLDGYGITRGFSLNVDAQLPSGMKMLVGGSFIDVFTEEEGDRFRPFLTERWTGTWNISYPIRNTGISIDYTGNLYGPMRLPVLGSNDPRPENSPWWSIQNIQISFKKPNSNIEFYSGVKNLLNYTPPANSIARPFDPFDRNVNFAPDGSVLPTPANPNALTFDPSYVFAPNQGIRGFIGIRYSIN